MSTVLEHPAPPEFAGTHKPVDAIIIGGGVAGLGAAWQKTSIGQRVVVLEAGGEVGGAVRSHLENGWLAEEGPHSLQVGDPALDAALRSIPGCAAAMVDALPEAKKRFLVRKGQVVAVPANPWEAARSPLLTWRGKLRFLAEPFLPRGPYDPKESAACFVRRRLGDEAYDHLIDALIGGIYAGDGEHLRLHDAFPKLARLEAEHGSLVRGSIALLLKKRREAKKSGQPAFRKRIVSFREGMGTLPRLLASAIGDGVRTGVSVNGIAQSGSEWIVESDQGSFRAPELIVAVPAHRLSSLPWPEAFRRDLGRVAALHYPPVSVLTVGFPRAALSHPLDGFGVLCPGCENQPLLGVLFPSSIFPGRAPAGHVTLAVFIGGTRQPELASSDPDALWAKVRPALVQLLGLRNDAAPVFRHLRYWERAIPQYDHRLPAAHAALAKVERAAGGSLRFVGNYRGGIALPATLESVLL